MITINEEIKCQELKESVRMMNSQTSNLETTSMIEEGKTKRKKNWP